MQNLHKIAAAFLLAGTICLTPVTAAFAQTAGQDMKAAGTDTKDATKEAGHGIAKGTKKAYHATKHGTKKAYHKTKNGTVKASKATAHATENVGDKIAGKPATH